MTTLTKLEREVIEMLLAGDKPVLVALRRQLQEAGVSKREATGHGFFTYLTVDRSSVPPAPLETKVQLGDVVGTIPGLNHGAGFLLFIEDGYLHFLEGFGYGETWPASVPEFQLTYSQSRKDYDALGISGTQ